MYVCIYINCIFVCEVLPMYIYIYMYIDIHTHIHSFSTSLTISTQQACIFKKKICKKKNKLKKKICAQYIKQRINM